MAARGGFLSVHDGPEELRAAVRALRAAPRDLRNQINRAMRSTMSGPWAQAVRESADTDGMAQRLIVKGALIRPGNPPTLIAGNSTRRISKRGGGLTPSADWHLAEYGADRTAKTTYQRLGYPVTRRTNTGWKQSYRRGRVLAPALAQIGPRLASLFVQTIVRGYMDILN